VTGPPSADRRGTDRARELADQISDALGHLHRLVRVLDDNELDNSHTAGSAKRTLQKDKRRPGERI
jgi:hypothetical protein